MVQIKNLKNGKLFIGSGLNAQGRLNSHKLQLQIGSHRNKALMLDWKEYGAENFSFEILEQLKIEGEVSHKDRKELDALEELYLEKLQPYDEKGYNSRSEEEIVRTKDFSSQKREAHGKNRVNFSSRPRVFARMDKSQKEHQSFSILSGPL